MLRIATYITANLPNLAARLASIMPDHAFLTLLPLSQNGYAILKTHRLTLFSKNFSHFTWLILDENSYESSDTLILELHNTYRKFETTDPILRSRGSVFTRNWRKRENSRSEDLVERYSYRRILVENGIHRRDPRRISREWHGDRLLPIHACVRRRVRVI